MPLNMFADKWPGHYRGMRTSDLVDIECLCSVDRVSCWCMTSQTGGHSMALTAG